MAKLIKCDRCGKGFTRNIFTGSRYEITRRSLACMRGIDLCQDCEDALDNLLHINDTKLDCRVDLEEGFPDSIEFSKNGRTITYRRF